LSQRELAAPGVSYAYISRIEAGTRQPSVKALRRLAAKLGVSAEYLETGSDIDDGEARELRLSDAELSLRLGDGPRAEQILRETLEEAVEASDTVNALRAQTALAFATFERGALPETIALLEEVVASGHVHPVEAVDVYTTLARAYVASGSAQSAIELLERCLDEIRALEPYDTGVLVRYTTLLSFALTDSGDLRRAEAVANEALEYARHDDADGYTRVQVYWSLGRLAEMEGRSAAALHYIRRAMALLEATDDTLHLARGHLGCAVIVNSQGNPEAAKMHLDEAERLFGPSPLADDAVLLKVERARVEASLRNGEAAVALAREALEQLGDQPGERGLAQTALGEGLALLGDVDGADEAFRLGVELLEEEGRWREAAQACRSLGRMLRRSGREEDALDALERASELSLRTSLPVAVER
jgi:tetratricopeptide (TPR) repeat protein